MARRACSRSLAAGCRPALHGTSPGSADSRGDPGRYLDRIGWSVVQGREQKRFHCFQCRPSRVRGEFVHARDRKTVCATSALAGGPTHCRRSACPFGLSRHSKLRKPVCSWSTRSAAHDIDLPKPDALCRSGVARPGSRQGGQSSKACLTLRAKARFASRHSSRACGYAVT